MLSRIYEHNFKNSFQNTLNPRCIYARDAENTYHFLLYCHDFLDERNTLFLNQADIAITKALLFGNLKCSNEVNFQTLNANIEFVLTSNDSMNFSQIFNSSELININERLCLSNIKCCNL